MLCTKARLTAMPAPTITVFIQTMDKYSQNLCLICHRGFTKQSLQKHTFSLQGWITRYEASEEDPTTAQASLESLLGMYRKLSIKTNSTLVHYFTYKKLFAIFGY